MSDIEHAQMILGMARKDLTALEGMRDARRFSDEIFGFHAQQAVEKALKAWLSYVGVAYKKTHDLEQLILALKGKGAPFPVPFERLMDLTDFAVQYRYGVLEDMGNFDRSELKAEVAALVEHVEKIIRGEGPGG